MNSRERVLTALDHHEPDRVPITIGGSAQKFSKTVIDKLVRRYGIPENSLRPVFAQFRFEYISEPLWERLGADFRHVYWQPERTFNLTLQKKGVSYIDEWGLDYDFSKGQGVNAFQCRRSALRDASVQDLDRYPWPSPEAYDRTVGMREEAIRLYEGTQYAVAAYRHGGIFDFASYLRGVDRFLVDLLKNKDFAHHLLGKITETIKSYYQHLMKAVGGYVHVVEIADDLGTQNGPLISPYTYDEFIKPCHADLVRTIKEKYPNVKVMIHCDGGVRPLLPSFIDAGIDILNPVQVTAKGMEPETLKKDFGKDLAFQGGIDTQQILRTGSPEEVAEEVKRMIDVMSPGGGYLLGPSHNFLPDIPIENIVAMFATAQSYGLA